MDTRTTVEITNTRLNPHIDPELSIWGWEIPVYLYLGGLVAGLLVLGSLVVLTRREEEHPTLARIVPLLGVPLLGLGLLALFLDLEYKLHVFRFYTAFRIGSPMSWGSWILLVVFATSGLSGIAALRRTDWGRRSFLVRLGPVRNLADLGDRWARPLAWANLLLGLALGIYTGILLSAFAARPLWSSAILGPLFLVSGISTGAALSVLLTRSRLEHDRLIRIDMGLIAVEGSFLALWLIGLLSGCAAEREAAQLLFGGPFTAAFWALVVVIGLALPFLLERMAVGGRWRHTIIAPGLILIGGLALRFVVVSSGQVAGMGG